MTVSADHPSWNVRRYGTISNAHHYGDLIKGEVKTNGVGETYRELLDPQTNEVKFLQYHRGDHSELIKRDTPIEPSAKRPIFALAQELSAITDWVVIVDEFVRRNPLHYDRAGLWYAWNRKRKAWETIDEVDLLNGFDSASRKSTLSAGIKAQVLEALKRKARSNEPKKAPATWVQFGDSVVDVENGKTFEATPDYRLTSPVPWTIGATTDTPTIDALLKSWAGEKEDSPDWRTLKSFLAYSTIQDTPVHIFLFIYGSGSNGKSVFVKLLKKFLGEENVASTTLERLQTNRFETFSLRGKLVANVGETEVAVLARSGILKAITGGDSLPIEAKGKGSFSEVLTVKVVINGNSVPSTTDRTDGFYRRALVVDFPNKFEGDKDPLLNVTDEEFNNLARWVATEELPRIVRERTLLGQGTTEQRRQRYEARSDVLGQFLAEKTVSDVDSYVNTSELASKFETYCKERGHRVMSFYELGRSMKERGYEKSKKWIPIKNGSLWVYEGLKFLPNIPVIPINPFLSIEKDRVELSGISGIPEGNLFDDFKNLFSGRYAGQALQITYVQKRLPAVTDDVLAGWLNRGMILELPAGWVRLV